MDEHLSELTRNNSSDRWLKRVSSFQDGKILLPHLDIELTERCNNNCIHCSINLDENDEHHMLEMSTEFIKDVLQQAATLGCLSVRFTGGEALIRADFEELYIYSRRLGLQVILFTNATLITEDTARLFRRIPPGKPIEITSYGMSAISYEAVTRRKGTFKAFRRGIDYLMKYKIPFLIKIAVLPPNLNELDEAWEWAKAISWNHEEPSCVVTLDMRSRRDNSNYNTRIRSLRMQSAEVLKILKHNKSYRKEMLQFCQKYTGFESDKLFNCNIGCGICIDAYGNVKGCLALQVPFLLYSLEEGTLRDAVTNYLPGFVNLKASNPAYLKRCAKCVLRGLCAQCSAKSWSEHGTLDTPVEYHCRIAHEHAYFLQLMQEGEKGWQVDDWFDRLSKRKAELGLDI
jgi:radical SAM protein with 4Fe4S-binding SPASM domain